MNKFLLIASAILLTLFTACTKGLDTVPGSSANIPSLPNEASAVAVDALNNRFVAGELLVKFKTGISETGKANAVARISGKVKEKIVTGAMRQVGEEGVFLIQTGLPALEAISRAKAFAEVEYAEPNFIYTVDATSTDTYYSNGLLWGMYGATTTPANQYGSGAAAAWAKDRTGSSSIIVGVIDEGAMHSHEDLSGAILNPGEFGKGAGVDDDGNGFTDDIYGWDFTENNNTTYDGTGDDHGTHVAGTIGAKNNGVGVVGVNWNVTMISAKFLGSSGGTLANAIKAVDYFTTLKSKGLNIVATNNSWGGGGYSQALYDAIERANRAGILFIAAAGNGGSDGVGDNNDKTPSYPASYTNTNIIAVAAINKTGGLASFSNYGVKSVDLGAPGVGVYSTLPGGYGSYNGTSMATPHVTGAAALYASTHPGATATQIRDAILAAAKSTPTSSLYRKTVTGGRLNASNF